MKTTRKVKLQPINAKQDAFIRAHNTEYTPNEMAEFIGANGAQIRNYMTNHGIEKLRNKTAFKVFGFNQKEQELIELHRHDKNQQELRAILKCGYKRLQQHFEDRGWDFYDSRQRKLSDEDLKIIEQNIHLKVSAIHALVVVNNKEANYQLVRNHYLKLKKQLECQGNVNFDIDFYKTTDIVTGPYYPYSNNIQFVQP
mgnify:CR=1 FL=1